MADDANSLSFKQRRFVEAYLQTWNATKAAEIAGYKFPNKQGPQLLVNLGIKSVIDVRMRETSMQVNEVLKRLTQQASNEASAYIQQDGSVDLAGLIADGKSHLIKGIKYDRRGNVVVEFYDAQAALALVGKAQRMFIEQVDMRQHLDQVAVNVYLPDNGRGDDASD